MNSFEKNNSSNEWLDNDFEKKISILKLFLDDKTIEFIIENNKGFLDRIPIESLIKSVEFYTSLDGYDYTSVIKWFPIMLDYDRFCILLNGLRTQDMSEDDIITLLERSVDTDFEIADKLKNNNVSFKEKMNKLSLEDIKPFANRSKTNNETFNNMLDKNIAKYENLLRRLT